MPRVLTILKVAVFAAANTLGPVPHNGSPHALLARTIVVNGTSAAADDEHAGTESQPLKTINRAAQLAQPGDTVLVRTGVYRERVAPAQGGSQSLPIVYAAASGQRVVIKGSEVWKPRWHRLDDEKPIYRGRLDSSMFAGLRIHPFQTRLKAAPDGQRLTLGQVFVDGKPLREVDNAETLGLSPMTWRVEDRGTAISVHFPHSGPPPGKRLIELTVRDRIFAPKRRGLGFLHVKGFIMEHCANQFPDRFWESDSPQAGALGCRSGHHWLIERNTIRFAKSIGIDCGYEGRRDLEGDRPTPQNTGHHVIRHNVVSDNGCCGIAGMRSLSTRIVGNVIERNNSTHHTAPEIGGIKVHYFIGGTIEGNLLHNNDAHGIWIDNVYRHARVTGNLVVGNRGNGIFVELGVGPILIDNNVIANTRPGFLRRDPRGDGFYSHDASGITFVHNLVFGSQRCGSFSLKVTKRRRAGASKIQLLNNIFIDNHQGNINLPLPGPDARDNRSDHNLYGSRQDFLVNTSGGISRRGLIRSVENTIGRRPKLWNGSAPRMTFQEWQQVSGWDLHSIETASAQARLSNDYTLSLNVGGAAHTVIASRIDGVEQDFFGKTIPPQNARVGPFQNLTHGENVLKLWHADEHQP